MCLTVYVGTEEVLAPVPWDDEHPGFHVRRVRGPKAAVRRLGKAYTYLAGAHTGCGCGFLGDDPDNELEHLQSMAALRSFLESAASRGAAEVLICWAGDEAKQAQKLDINASAVADLDLSSAWQRPLRLVVRQD
jgi:hypothetical protein